MPSLVWYFESFVSFIIQDGHCYFVILSLFFSNIFLFPLKNKPFRSFMLINSSHIPIFMRTSFTNSLSPCCPYSPCFIWNFYVYAPALYHYSHCHIILLPLFLYHYLPETRLIKMKIPIQSSYKLEPAAKKLNAILDNTNPFALLHIRDR